MTTSSFKSISSANTYLKLIHVSFVFLFLLPGRVLADACLDFYSSEVRLGTLISEDIYPITVQNCEIQAQKMLGEIDYAFNPQST